jgi:nucleoid-associated protein YgaU
MGILDKAMGAASDVLGLGAAGGELHKLTISYEKKGRPPVGVIEALFNPSEISLSKSATWEQQRAVGRGGASSSAMEQEFRSVEAETFSIELFFDTYESRSGGSAWRRAATSYAQASLTQTRDVRQHTGPIARLLDVDPKLDRPPICQLCWGAFDIFTGVLAGLDQRFTLFLNDGTPVRATLTCRFIKAMRPAVANAGKLHSSDVVKTRQLQRNHTLQSVAAEEYGDPSLWRNIARANGIVNPRDLAPGTVLTIPKLRP